MAVNNNNSNHRRNSPHYDGDLHTDTAMLSPEEIKSGQRYKVPVGTFSIEFGQNPVYGIDPDTGDYIFRTSSNVFRFKADDIQKNGLAFGNDDLGHDEWRAACEDVYPAMFDEVPFYSELVRQQLQEMGLDTIEDGVMQSKPRLLHLPNKRDTSVLLYAADETAIIPMNKRGYYASRLFEWSQHITNYLFNQKELNRGEFDPETEAWVTDLLDGGYTNPLELMGLGIGIMPKQALAQIRPTSEGVYLLMNERFEELTSQIARKYNLPKETATRKFQEYLKAHIDSTIAHEIYHMFPKGLKSLLGRSGLESRIGKRQERFYGERKDQVHEGLQTAYQDLEIEARNYKRAWSPLKFILNNLLAVNSTHKSGRSVESIVAELTAEARRNGVSEDNVQEYIESNITEYVSKYVSEEDRKTGMKEALEQKETEPRENPEEKEDEEDEDIEESTEETSEV